MYFFCTYFDKNFLPRGLTLVDSLKEHCLSFKIFILCLDEETFDYLSQLKQTKIHPIRLSDLEKHDPELLAAKSNRSRIEYFFTLSPCLPLHLLNHFPETDHITYLDSDLCFFSNPKAIYDELGDKSILIIPHYFSSHLSHLTEFGIFNVGCQIFRKDKYGLECLNYWRKQCLKWCYDVLEGDGFADQKYLDKWPALYKDNLVISEHPGINLAPWNFDNYKLSLDQNGHVKVDGKDLIFYHFQRLRFIKEKLVTHGLDEYKTKPDRILKNHIYAPYLGRLIRKNKIFNQTKDLAGRNTKTYSFWQIKRLLKYGYTFLYVSDQWCIRFRWYFF